MKHGSAYEQFVILVERENYALAEEVCRAALARGEDQQFWQTQLGYVCFLNEKDAESFFDKAPDAFTSLVNEYPLDDNAHFWLGYILDIVRNDPEKPRQEYRATFELNPRHAYAKLTLAGIVDRDQGIRLLREVLEEQPTNFRALRQLADTLIAANRHQEAVGVLEVLLRHNAYVEEGYGIMNQYMNGVLTGASHEQRLQEEARAMIRDIEGSKNAT